MIQPVSADCRQASFRLSDKHTSSQNTKLSKAALLNAGGISIAVGGLTTAISRSYTSAWSQAAIIGFCATVMSMFLMTPQLLHKLFVKQELEQQAGDAFIKESSPKIQKGLKKNFKPTVALLK